MTKAEMIAAIADKTGLTKTDADSAMVATFDLISEIMANDGEVRIPGFGSFKTKIRAERKGRNPSTGEEITIPKAKIANFKPAAQLKEAINNQ